VPVPVPKAGDRRCDGPGRVGRRALNRDRAGRSAWWSTTGHQIGDGVSTLVRTPKNKGEKPLGGPFRPHVALAGLNDLVSGLALSADAAAIVGRSFFACFRG